MADEQDGFWGVVEIMGHQRYAGYVSEQTLGGAALIRVDVPEVSGRAAFSKLLRPRRGASRRVSCRVRCRRRTSRLRMRSTKVRTNDH